MSDEEEISRIERDSLTEGYIPSADAGWLIDKLRSAREDGARLDWIYDQLVPNENGVSIHEETMATNRTDSDGFHHEVDVTVVALNGEGFTSHEGIRAAIDRARSAAPTGRETGKE